jgi:hypothetical protein
MSHPVPCLDDLPVSKLLSDSVPKTIRKLPDEVRVFSEEGHDAD